MRKQLISVVSHYRASRVPSFVASESPQIEWMQSARRVMAANAKGLRPGGETVIANEPTHHPALDHLEG